MSDEHQHGHDHNDDGSGHGHGHGHGNNRGWSAIVRYLRNGRRMWRNEMNRAVVALVDSRRGETVVDLGAGMGPGSVLVSKTGAKAVAVEPTPFLRRILQFRRAITSTRSRIEIVDGAAEAIPLGDGEADAVMAVNSMHHWVDLADAVGEIARVLAPGGRIVLVDEAFDDPTHPDHERFAKRRRRHGHGHGPDDGADEPVGPARHGFHDVDGQHVAGLLAAAGFAEIVAIDRRLLGRPVLAVTASRPPTGT